ncbi:reverse transcriptase domain-containing protein [Tanacetum coccineum]
MILELADRTISTPTGIAEDVFVKVGTFFFPTDFVVVDYIADPRVPLILGRPFLRTARALIDVHGEQMTLRHDDQSITFKVGDTKTFSHNTIESVNRVDVIDVACEEYAQEVLGFLDISKSGNSTPTLEPILSTSPPSLTLFEGGDFILEEIKACLTSKSIPPRIDDADFDPKEDLLTLERLLNSDPSSTLPPEERKLEELKTVEPSSDELPEFELKAPSIVCPRKVLNDATRKDHFPLPFMDQMLERLAGNEYYCFLDGFLGYFQIPIYPKDQEKTTFTCPYGTFAYRRMPFGLCNAPGTLQRCMMVIFHDMIKETLEVFMDDLSVFEDSFSSCLSHLEKMLKRCEGTNLVLNWEKCHFMVKEGIVLGHKISKSRIEVDKAKVDVIAKLPHPTSVKGIRSAVFWQQKELLAVVYAFEKFRPYLVLLKTIVYADHSALKYLLAKQDAKPRLLRWILLLQEFDTPFYIKQPVFGVFLAKKPMISSWIVIMDPPRDIIVPTTPLRKSLMPVSFGLLFTEMPMTWSHGVTLVNVKEKSHKGMKCHKMQSKFARSLTCGASTSWDCSRLHKGTSIYSWPLIICQNRTPRAIISDRGTHFCNDQFAKVMLKYGVTHRLSTTYHPQTSGQVEVSNRGLKQILERTVGEHRASWSDKLDDALWAFRTTFKTPIGCTPFKLVYGKASYENSLIYKEKTKRIHDSKIKNRVFNVGDRVLLFNSRLKIFSGNLKTRWTGPFTVTQVFPYGTVELSQTDRPNFKVNGHRLKHYFGGDIPPVVVSDLQTFPMDN